jgi:hypothetical protein
MTPASVVLDRIRGTPETEIDRGTSPASHQIGAAQRRTKSVRAV